MDLTLRFALALGLGLLVGLERERTSDDIAGIRTFTLITLLGAVCGALSVTAGGWTLAAGLVATAALFVVANVFRMRRGDADAGLTTEVAGLVMFGVGALLALDHVVPAVITAGAVAVLLYAKAPLHDFTRKLDPKELRAIFRLALIALVILPALPDETYGPYEVLNPFRIWLMVVLIVGISLAAYVAYRLLGRRAGTIAAGLLGGLISSTATTVSSARESRSLSGAPVGPGLVIVLASTVVFARVLVEIAVAAPSALGRLAPPIVAMMGVLAIAAVCLFVLSRGAIAVQRPEPPTDLRAAIVFGLLYALVLLGVAAAERHFGTAGVYAVAALSGLTDMDAITLSTAQLVVEERIAADTGWRTILIASMANLVFKAGIVVVLGTRALAWRVAAAFALGLAGGVAILLFWP